MKIEIDQSGKIEFTSVETVIGDSLGNFVFIKAKTKRLIQNLFRDAKKPRKFIVETFVFLVAKLIQISFSKENVYIIDVEYPGKQKEIMESIIRISRKFQIQINLNQIRFSLIGKKSKAHATAYLQFKRKNKKGDITVRSFLRTFLP